MTLEELAAAPDPSPDVEALGARDSELDDALAAVARQIAEALEALRVVSSPPQVPSQALGFVPPPHTPRDRLPKAWAPDEEAIAAARARVETALDLQDRLRLARARNRTLLAALARLQLGDELDRATRAANAAVGACASLRRGTVEVAELRDRYDAAVHRRRDIWLRRFQQFGLDEAPELLVWPEDAADPTPTASVR